MRMTPVEQRIVDRIAQSWSREKDNAQRGTLEHEIQFQLGCPYGRAASLAKSVRLTWPLADDDTGGFLPGRAPGVTFPHQTCRHDACRGSGHCRYAAGEI